LGIVPLRPGLVIYLPVRERKVNFLPGNRTLVINPATGVIGSFGSLISSSVKSLRRDNPGYYQIAPVILSYNLGCSEIFGGQSIFLSEHVINCRSCKQTAPRCSVKNFKSNPQTPLGVSFIQSRHQSSLPVFYSRKRGRILPDFRILLSKLTSSGRGTSVTP